MAIPSSFTEGELRCILQGATFTKAFTAADDAAWDVGAAEKINVYDVDLAGLTEEWLPDPALQTRFDGRNPPIRVKRGGSFKFKAHLEGGSANTTPSLFARLLGACMGGLLSPDDISDLAEAASSTTRIKATAHTYKDGQALLFGAVGDGGGGGKVSVIEDESGTGADDFDLELALPAAPGENAVIKAGHTIYLDPSVENYVDFLFIGSHSGTGVTDDPDQIQMIGCAGKFTLGGLAVGEIPYAEFEFFVANWQWVSQADQAALSHTEQPTGGKPIYSSAEGQIQIQDLATTTRKEIAGGDVEIDMGFFDIVPVLDNNGPNRIGGFKRVRTEQGPRVTVKAYWSNLADMPGMANDLRDGTPKQVLLQYGNTAQATMGVYMRRSYLQGLDPSNRVELERNTALELTFEGSGGRATSLGDVYDHLSDGAFAICLL